MGQLERYGLYVLCVVIFLILGVALWGGDPAVPGGTNTATAAVSRDLRSSSPANDPPSQPSPNKDSAGKDSAARDREKDKDNDDAVARLRRAFGTSSDTDKPRATDKSVEPLAGVTSAPASDAGKTGSPALAVSTDYVIKKDDRLEAIALLHLGKRTAWPEIVKLNPGLSPTKLVAGEKIKLPAKAGLAAPAAAPLAADEYEIKKDDTLEEIALAKLGKKSRWREIAAANPGLNAALLRPGTRIKVPARTAAVANAKR